MITVRELCELFADDFLRINIWNGISGKKVFNKIVHDAIYCEYADCQVESIDMDEYNVITLNIWTNIGVLEGE